MTFLLTPADLGDPTACHTIQVFVADSFSSNGYTAGDVLGADSITWFYMPGGPNGCTTYDAGDGSFPSDAPADGPLLVPDAT